MDFLKELLEIIGLSTANDWSRFQAVMCVALATHFNDGLCFDLNCHPQLADRLFEVIENVCSAPRRK